MRQPLILIAVVLSMTTSLALGAIASPWDHWRAHDSASLKTIDHSLWETILLNFIRAGSDGVHRVAYRRMHEGDRKTLDDYLNELSETRITSYRRDEQMAYWINLYNALTVDLVLEHYPISSLRKLEADTDRGVLGPWDRKLIKVEGIALSLNDIEKRILKPIWQDLRIQYALSCAAIGCPNLQPVPYAGTILDKQLSNVTMAYVNDKRCITIEGNKLVVSSLYRWNLTDFGSTDQDVIHHLMAYAKPDLAMSLQKFDRIHGDGFDWRLNDSKE